MTCAVKVFNNSSQHLFCFFGQPYEPAFFVVYCRCCCLWRWQFWAKAVVFAAILSQGIKILKKINLAAVFQFLVLTDLEFCWVGPFPFSAALQVFTEIETLAIAVLFCFFSHEMRLGMAEKPWGFRFQLTLCTDVHVCSPCTNVYFLVRSSKNTIH